MKRLLATLRCDVRLQFRNGFYYATGFVLLVWAVVIRQLAASGVSLDLAFLLPAMLLNNMLIGSFFFLGGLVLLERGEGTLEAQVVTPLRVGEYLLSKVISLGGLALTQHVALVLLIAGPRIAVLPLLAGLASAATLYILTGFAVVVRYRSINDYLLPSIPYAAVLMLPVLYAAGWDHWLLYLHPMQPAVVLMRAAFAPVALWQLVYGVFGSALWIALGYLLARRSYDRFVVAGVETQA
ncbi:MAG TPA: ABC transporter permease [Roseiflexaceae bacterium]|nr:ABC transporter permease [Roseiflexaceae bacterium]